MKNQNNYNRFILFSNAPLCVYGNTIVRHSPKRVLQLLLNKCLNYFRSKTSG
jgi:hypothetical protein